MPDHMAALAGTWRQVVAWAFAHRQASWAAALLLGVALFMPWGVASLQTWLEVQEQLDQQGVDQRNLAALEATNADLRRTLSAAAALQALPGVSRLSEGAHQHGLQITGLTMGKPVRVLRTDSAELQQFPVSFKAQGTWADWSSWVSGWPQQMPSTHLNMLELVARPDGAVDVQVSVAVPQRVALQAEPAPSAQPEDLASSSRAALADATAWAATQQQQAQQHPSFAPWMAQELNRPRQALEAFPREQLRYIGHLTQAGRSLALVRVMDPGQSALSQVHTVSVGAYLGQDFGRVEVVDAAQLQVRELVRDANGAWQTRRVTLPWMETRP